MLQTAAHGHFYTTVPVLHDEINKEVRGYPKISGLAA
jgi:hypothetical protein